MSFIAVLAVLYIAGVCAASPASRIVNGRPTTVLEYPSVVQLDSFLASTGVWNHNCGGAILNQRYILSAAQCTDVRIDLHYTPANRRIRAGATVRNTGGVIRSVASVLNHPGFSGPTLNVADADISLIGLTQVLQFGEGIMSIAIVPQGFVLPNLANVTLAGWGATSNFNPESPVLLAVNLHHRTVCDIPGQNLTENMMCAGSIYNNIEGACRGDVGGPMHVQGILTGVISWFAGCQNLIPTVCTKVSSYTNWIIANAV